MPNNSLVTEIFINGKFVIWYSTTIIIIPLCFSQRCTDTEDPLGFFNLTIPISAPLDI